MNRIRIFIVLALAVTVGGARTAVLHVTHDPPGFICTPVRRCS